MSDLKTVPTKISLSCFFDKLPLEILQQIGQYIEDDKDLENYKNASHSTRDAIEADNYSFWYRRFLHTFDPPQWTQLPTRLAVNNKYRKEYKARQRLLNSAGVYLFKGQSEAEQHVVNTIGAMLIQSISKNLTLLLKFVKSSNMHVLFAPRKRGTRAGKTQSSENEAARLYNLLTVQCVLAPTVLTSKTPSVTGVYQFLESQHAIYSTTIPLLLRNSSINIVLLAHMLNFWKLYLSNDETGPLHGEFAALDKTDHPRYFKNKLQHGVSHFGRVWKGTYAYLSESSLVDLRANGKQPHIDEFPAEQGGGFQELRLDMVGEDHYWPQTFQQHFSSTIAQPVEPSLRTRAQRRLSPAAPIQHEVVRSFFRGLGTDQEDAFFATGRLTSLPPEQGIPGWHHVEMMKYYVDEITNVVDEDSLWAHEGILLPGGKIMLGRWWRAEVNSSLFYSGPFILWCVDN